MTVRREAPLMLACAALCVAFLAFYSPLPQVADELAALPIARAAADPGLYPAGDLIVAGGLRGPFHLYRLAGALYTQHANVDAWWFGILLAALFATFASVWALSRVITGSALLASAVTAMVAAANPFRGTINWFVLPQLNLVTSTLATPVTVAALALAIAGHRAAGLVVGALLFSLHPAMGLLTTAAIAVLMIVVPEGRSWRWRLRWFAIAAACALPNAMYIATSTPGNFAAGLASPLLSFAEQFRLYAYHVFIADHWRDGYAWFLLQLGGMIALRSRLAPRIREATVATVATLVGFALLYLANVYTINYVGITITFAVRAVGFVKPLAFAAVAAIVVAWAFDVRGAQRPVRVGLAGLLAVATVHKNMDIGEGLAALFWGAVVLLSDESPRRIRWILGAALVAAGVFEVLGQGWGILHVAQFSPSNMDVARLATIAAALAFLGSSWWWQPAAATVPGTADPVGARAGRSATLAPIAACAAVLFATVVLRGHLSYLVPASPGRIAARTHIAEPAPELRGIVEWAARESPRATLFAVPPLDGRFAVLRLAAGRGTYASPDDVNQLVYDAAHYGEAHRRLIAQGMKVLGPHRFDAAAWDTLGAAQVAILRADGVDFAVFPSVARRAHLLDFPVAYQDDAWLVYDLRASR